MNDASICACGAHGFVRIGYAAVALFDADRLAEIKARTWHLAAKDGIAYARASVQRKSVYMHRLLAGATSVDLIDHADRDGINNLSVNLRLATIAQNNANAKLRVDNLSGAKGVSWCKQYGKWRTVIGIKGKKKSLGRFDDLGEAKLAYQEAAKAIFGQFARME